MLIYSIENTFIKVKFRRKKKNKILIDLVDDKTAIKFMDLFGKKNLNQGQRKEKINYLNKKI